MDSAEFLKQEYITLREEARETKERIFKTLGFALLVVPSSSALATKFDLDAITLFLPILVVAIALLYLSENNSMMRCGKFIKENIEARVIVTHVEGRESHVKGWEHWLEERKNRDARNVDRHLSYAFYLLFFVYFAASVFMVGSYAVKKFAFDQAGEVNENGAIAAAILVGAYIALGLWFVIYLVLSIRLHTDDKPHPVQGRANFL
jgi:hypothetical protein